MSGKTLWNEGELSRQDRISCFLTKGATFRFGLLYKMVRITIARQVLTCTPKVRDRIGKPRKPWKNTIIEDLDRIRMTWNEAWGLKLNHTSWKKHVTALHFTLFYFCQLAYARALGDAKNLNILSL